MEYQETKPHIIRLCLAPELRSALIKYMAKHDLDKEYAALHLLVKALYGEQLISREVYEVFSFRYSRRLVRNDLERLMTQEQLRVKQELEHKAKLFSMVLDQWHLHGEDWRRKWIAEAEKWRDRVPSAQLVLDLGKSGV